MLGAAERLEGEPIRFRMVGRGQQLGDFHARAEALSNVDLVPRWVGYDELTREIRAADVCLGVFGTTEKADRVIPCKVFDALAVGKPVITADSTGARELLTSGETAILVPSGDAEALAAAIRELSSDRVLLRRVGAAGHDLFRTRASPDALGRRFAGLLRALLEDEGVAIDARGRIDELVDASLETIRKNKLTACYVRPLIYMADGAMGLGAVNPTRVAIIAFPWGA